MQNTRFYRAVGAGWAGPVSRAGPAVLLLSLSIVCATHIGVASADVPQSEEAAPKAPSAPEAKVKPSVPALMQMLKHADPLKRREAAKALGQIGPGAKDAIPALKAALKDSEVRVRWRAAYALWKVDRERAEEVILPLGEAIRHLDDSQVKDRADDRAAEDAFFDVMFGFLENRLREPQAKPKK